MENENSPLGREQKLKQIQNIDNIITVCSAGIALYVFFAINNTNLLMMGRLTAINYVLLLFLKCYLVSKFNKILEEEELSSYIDREI